MLIGSRAAAKKGDEEGQGDLTLQPFASTKVIATRLRMVATVCLRIPTEGFEDLNGIKDVVGLEHQDDDRVTPPKRFSSLPTLERHSVDYDDDDDKFRLAVQEQPQLCASPAELELPELDCLALDWSLSSGAIGSEPEHHSRHHSLETGIPSVLESVPLASAKVAATKRSSKRKSLGSLIELLTLSHQQQEQQKEHSDPLLEPPSSPSPKGSRKKSSWNFQAVTDLANPLLLHKSLSEFRRQRVPSSPERLQGEPSVGEEGLDQTATSVKSKKGILQTCPSVAGPSSSAKKCPKDYFPNVASPTRKFLSQIGRSSSSSASSVSPSRHSSNSGKTIKGSPKQLHKKALSPILTPKEELEVDILNIQWVSVNRDRQERIPWRGDVGLIVCNATPGDAISSLSLPSLLESGVKNEEGQRLVLTEPVFSDLIEKDVSFPPSSGSNQSSNVTLGADSPEEEQTDSGLFLEFSRSRSKTEESLSPALSRQSSQATLFPNGASSGHGTAALCSSDSALPVLKEDVGGDDDVATLNPIRRSFTEPKRLSDLARSDTWTPSFFTGKQKSEFPVSNTNGQKKLGKSKTVHEPYKGLSRKDSTTQHILYYDPILEASWKSQGTFNRSDSFSKPARGQRASSTISSTGTVGSALSRQVSGKRASRRSSSITSPRHLWNWFQSSSSSVSPPVSPHPPAPPPSPVLSPSRSPGYLSIGHPASGHFAEDQN